MNKIFGAFTDSANLFWGALVTVWAHFIGANWPVFALFLVLNVIDCHYGRQKAIKTNTLSSKSLSELQHQKLACFNHQNKI